MKTSKTTSSKPKKASEAGEATKSKKVTSKTSAPSEDEIREKAREIYYERIARGEHGTPEDDWHEAEEILRGS
jgi:hypothetical protein